MDVIKRKRLGLLLKKNGCKLSRLTKLEKVLIRRNMEYYAMNGKQISRHHCSCFEVLMWSSRRGGYRREWTLFLK